MKKLLGIGMLGLVFTFAACEQDQRTSEQVLEVDTTGVEYEVEKTIKERQVDVDTTTESRTIEKNLEDEPQGQTEAEDEGAYEYGDEGVYEEEGM